MTRIYDTKKFTDEDFKLARDSWRRDLCGDEKTNDRSVPGIDNLLLMIDMDSEQLRRDMHRESDTKMLFGDKIPTVSSDMTLQYNLLYRMALPYGTVGCRGYKSAELLCDVLYAMDWMYDNMYGECVITDTSFRSWKLFDWWDWYIGASCPMMNVLMIIEDGITPELIKKYTAPISYLRYKMKLEDIPAHMMSRMMSMTPLALLTCDRELMAKLCRECDILLDEHDDGDNMRRDMCCMTHGLAYNLAYGFINLDRVARILKILGTTPLAYPIPTEKQYILMRMIRYTFAPSMYRGRPFVPMNGRRIQLIDTVENPLRYFCYAYGVFGADEDREIKEIIRRNRTDKLKEQLVSHFDSGVTLEEYRSINPAGIREPSPKLESYAMLYDALTNPEYDTPPYELGYMWYSGDTAVQFRNENMVGVRMCSSRAPSYECINGLNGDGWYTGEGSVYLYTPDSSEEYTERWWRSADKHLIPGTTVDERVREPINLEFGYRNSRDFVGGVALEESFLTMSMDQEAFHNEIEGRTEDNGHGRGLPIHKCTLTSKKSYFLLDKAAVCIGCDVSANDGYAVRTVVDNRLLEMGECIYVNGEKTEFAPGDTVREDVKYLYFEKCGAYFFPEGGRLIIRFYEKEGDRRVAVWFDHGVDPRSGSYAYVILPGVSLEAAEKYDISDIEITRNDSVIQAVRERHSGLCGSVFREAAELWGIRADQPMIAMTRRDTAGDTVSMAVCDPTQKSDRYSFTIRGCRLSATDGDAKLGASGADLSVEVTTDSAKGRAYYFMKSEE